MPKKCETRFAALRLMADERTRSVRLTIKPNEIEIGAQSSEEGEAQERVTADYTGEEVSIGFNSQYLQDFLNIVGAGETENAAVNETKNETDGETVRVKETSVVRVSLLNLKTATDKPR